MSNHNQAIARKTQNESFTFTDVPSPELRKDLAARGFRYRNGQWFRSIGDSAIVGEEEVAKHIAA